MIKTILQLVVSCTLMVLFGCASTPKLIEKGFFYDAHILLLQSFVNSPQLAATLKKKRLASSLPPKR